VKKQSSTNAGDTSSELFKARAELEGKTEKIQIEELDSRLLWAVVCTLAHRSASIQLGVTKDGGAWAVQYWDGKAPLKEYFNDTHSLNRSFAALLRAAHRNNLPPELEATVREYGW